MMDLLLKNKFLSNGLMSDVEKTISLILESPIAPYIDMNNIRLNVKTLKVKEASDDQREAVSYNSKDNTIYVNPTIIDEFDSKFLLTKGLIGLLSNNNKEHLSGFTRINGLKGIDEGVRDNLAEALVGNDANLSMYDDEKIIVRLLQTIYGTDVVLKSFFDNKPEVLLDKMNVRHYGPIVDSQLLSDIHENYYHRIDGNKSLLGEIEMQLIDLLLAKDNLDEKTINEFTEHLCVSSKMFEDKKSMYASVEEVYPYLDEQLKLKKGKQL